MKLNKPVVSVLAGLTILYPNAAEAAENGINEPENSVYELELETELNSEQGFEDKDNTDQLIDEQNVEKEQSAEMTDSEVVEDGKGDIKEDIKVEKNNKLEESNNDKVLEEPISTQSEVTTFAINELKPGVSSPRVKQMKEDLAKLGFVVSANPNNDYGPQTAAVVKEFQQYYGLEATGVADETTLNKIDKVLSSPYQYGNSSAEIKQLKLKLAKLGYVVSNNPNEDFGPSTREIVRSFQRDQGLRINGIIDEVTLNKIDELLEELEGPLKPGMSNPRVKQMKEDLAKLGFVVSANPNNDYGPQTAAVVKEFQQYYGLEATGVADETTLNKIDKVLSSPYQYGNSSAEIKQLKLKLAKLGYVVSNNPNEDFGPSTREIVRSFQRDQGLRINGIIDEVTLNKIDELLEELEGPLKPGMSNPRVKQMKEDLAKLGFVVSANPNNDYGPQTAAVVKEFQQYYGLEATGVADETTLNKIDKVLSSPYQYGNSSAEIKQLKLKLAKLGYVVSNNPNEDFGPSTREIVRSFQRDQGLRINGIIDEVTLNKIDELLGELEGPLKPGMSNPLVKQMKEDLAKLGFVVSANPNNDYGPQTAAVVKEFQQYYGLEATGVADEATLNKIHEVLSSPYQLYHSSPEIKKLKMKLLRLGFVVSNNPNEDYGLKTAEVVKEFQKTFGLRVNGIIDEVTLNKINELFDNKFVINRVYYDITLDQAVKIQLEAPGTPPQTDKYRNDPAYVSGSYISVYDGGNISGSSVNIRTSPKLGTNDNIFATVGNGEKFIVLNNNVEGDEFNGSKKWYKILYNNKEVYVHSTLATIGSKVGLVKDEVNVRSKPNTSGHIFGKAKKNDILTVVKQENNGWYEVKYTTWRNATADDVRQYLDPENFVNNEIQMFQFLDLTKPSGVSVAKLNEYLKGKGVLEGMGAAFQEAARQHGINDLYLVSHALLETGNGTSQLARGINVNGKTVYNVYGIGAIDEDPDKYGSQKAYEEGWTSVEKAIIGGAAFIGNDYIKAGQNTLYKMRWNPDSMASHGVASHQYATDIGWASKQLNNLYNLYKYVGDYQLQLEVPVYKK